MQYIRVMYHLAGIASKRYRIPFDDAVFHAVPGLLAACRNYDPAKGAPSTLLFKCIRQSIHDGIVSEKPVFGPSDHSVKYHAAMRSMRDPMYETEEYAAPHDVVNVVDNRDESEWLRINLHRLPRRTHLFVLLHYFRGWSYPRIGRRFGMSRQNVHQVIAVGLSLLRFYLQGAE